MQDTENYIENSLFNDVFETLLNVSISSKVQDAEKIYMLGYARFFNSDTTYCDTITLALLTVGGPRLTQTLRVEMNRLLTNFNNKLEQAVTEFVRASGDARFTFFATDRAFEGHRFCEPDQMGDNTFLNFDDKIWFWTATTAGVFTGSDLANEQAQADSLLLDAYRRGPSERQQQAEKAFDWRDILQLEKGLSAGNNGQWYFGQSGTGPQQGTQSGALLRPFHPTRSGISELLHLCFFVRC